MSNLFPISDDQRKLFGELLWNELAESPEDNWSDYDAVVLTYVQVAPVWMLESSRDSLPDAVQARIDTELATRKA
jgi:hypothetical protein